MTVESWTYLVLFALVAAALLPPFIAKKWSRLILFSASAAAILWAIPILFGKDQLTRLRDPLAPVGVIAFMQLTVQLIQPAVRRAVYRLGKASNMTKWKFRHYFDLLYVLGMLLSTILNNDSMIILLMPVAINVVSTAGEISGKAKWIMLYAPFAAIGVAPHLLANPINMLLADSSQLGFNQYVLAVFPSAMSTWVLTWVILRLLFRRLLSQEVRNPRIEEMETSKPGELRMLFIVLLPIFLFPVLMPLLDMYLLIGPVLSAMIAVMLFRSIRWADVREMDYHIFLFLIALQAVAFSLNDGVLIETMTAWYKQLEGPGIVGISAIGSGVWNNHTITALNLVVLETPELDSYFNYLCAAVGGDLGPQMLPTGSLAGILWMGALSKTSFQNSLIRFVLVGTLITVIVVPVAYFMLQLGVWLAL